MTLAILLLGLGLALIIAEVLFPDGLHTGDLAYRDADAATAIIKCQDGAHQA